ncbi:MAG: CehA/McbA family metallohydrolase, partial [Coprobacillaceae bacterium]
MQRTKKRIWVSILAMLMTVSTLFSLVYKPVVLADSTKTDISGWTFNENPTFPADSNVGENLTATVDTNANGRDSITRSSDGSIYLTGWDVDKYWEFNLDTTGYEDITFTTKTRSSGSGPKNWKLVYSVDGGGTWVDIDNSSIENANTLSERYSNFALPEAMENQANVKLRMVVTTNDAVNAGATINTSSGTARIGDVMFRGFDPNGGGEEPGGNETDIPDPITEDMIPSDVSTIDEALALADNATVTFIGQVTYAFGNATQKNTYLLQDVISGEVLGLQVYDYTNAYTIGDIVTVTGTMATYGSVRQVSSISDVTKLNYDVAPFPAQEVTLEELENNSDDYISEYVLIKNVTLGTQLNDGSNNTGNATATDGTRTINIYRGALYPDGITAGSVVDLYACWSKYNTTKQFRVGSSSDYVDYSSNVDTSITYNLANWTGTTRPESVPVYGDTNVANDYLDTNVELTHSTGNVPGVSGTSGIATMSIGYKGMVEGDYYQLKLDSLLCGNVTLSYKMRGSGTGPRDFQIYYSTDGLTYELANNTIYKKTTSDAVFEDYEVTLPSLANNAGTLYIRIQVASSTSIAGNTIGTGGTNYIQEIEVNGNPLISDSIVRMPEVSPSAGEVLAGQEVTMTCATSGAKIMYSLDGGNTYNEYNSASKPTLDTLPAKLLVSASKDGLQTSLEYAYDFTQMKVASVKASPNGGAVVLGSKVTLTTATTDATIEYSLDNGTTWNVYSTTDKVTLDTLPATMLVKAKAPGYLDSSQTTLSFTQRENETYNIYFGQLHSHTDFSDGSGTIDQAYSHAREANQVDFLAVTDHSNSFDNANNASILDGSVSNEWVTGKQKAQEYTTDTFVGLFGYEMTWSNGLGHMNTFNTAGFQSRTQTEFGTYSTALQNYYAALKKDTGSLSQFNHPGTTFGDFSDFSHYDEETDALIPLIEVGNGEGAIGSSGYFPSYQYYTRALDKGWHVAPTNNQDNHKGNWGDANTARTVVLADTLTEENIYAAIRNMRVYSTEDNDLEIYYTLDGYIMGSVLDEDSVGETIDISVDLKDATDSKIGTVQVISNGGVVVAEKKVNTNDETVTFSVSPDYSYYYIKVIQDDGDIAVTAAMWIGEVEAAGISSISTSEPLPVAGEALDVNLELYNNETETLEIQEVSFTVNDEVIHQVELDTNDLTQIDPFGSKTYSFNYTHESPGSTNIYVTVKATLNGVEKLYTDVLQLNYTVSEMVTKIVVDGTHYNDYVTGYYGANMGEFSKLAANNYAQVNIVTDEITADTLEDCNLLIISAPAKKSGTGNAGNFVESHFEDDFIDLVVDYANSGGTVILCGLADYQDTVNAQTSTEMNKLLVALGATTRVNSDETWDDDNNGGQQYRLYPTDHNADSLYTTGVSDTQKFSAYSGCTILLDEAAVSAGTARYLVKGHDTTYSIDSRDYDNNYVEIDKGNAIVLAHETLSSGANVFVSGTVFMSDFEITAVIDNVWDEPYSNQTIMGNILDEVSVELETSTIADARKGNLGDVYAVEGWVTAGTAVPGNTFFDTIYVQDETGGITIFPYAEAGLEIGTKVRIIGYVDEYQGDKELQIMQSEILDAENLNVIEPRIVS